jgi:hypothetical protein
MSERLWPEDLQLDDCFEFDGHEYVVVGTGPNEATLERIGDDSFTIEVFRWAFTESVGVELKSTISQEEFEQSLQTDADGEEVPDE